MESNENQEKILAQREYNINIEKSEYVLRAEIDENYIYLVLYEINDFLHNYKHKMDLSNIVSTLELEPSTYSDLESILKLFDDLFKNNKIEINKIDDKVYNILIELNLNENEIKNMKELIKENKIKELDIINKNNKLNSAREYEILLQKEEQNNREHIGIEHQFRIQCEKYAQEIDTLEEEKIVLLIQIVSNISIYIYIKFLNYLIGISKKGI